MNTRLNKNNVPFKTWITVACIQDLGGTFHYIGFRIGRFDLSLNGSNDKKRGKSITTHMLQIRALIHRASTRSTGTERQTSMCRLQSTGV